jgi:uncharacterized small protein (DUF1192 family)
MRQHHSTITSKSFSTTLSKNDMPESFPMVMADSLEVMEYYYRGKIQELEQSLAKLNVLEHARQIAALCKEIIRTKQTLQKIFTQKRAGR